MKTNIFKKIIYTLGIALFFSPAFISVSSCSDWTEPEAKDYYEQPTEAYAQSLKDYFKSPHSVMFGWFGNWAGKSGTSMQYSLMGLPDSTDFVSLWLCWGNLTQAQQDDLKEFQARGSRAVLCWLSTNIGENITPVDGDYKNEEECFKFWGIDANNEETFIEASRKYAIAIADTCRKYNIDGFDADLEANGTLIDFYHPERLNTFLRTLRQEFDKDGRMLVVDIPGGSGWLGYYNILEDDVVESIDYFVWQTYDLYGDWWLEDFFNKVRDYKPNLFENVLKKSIITATFEQATKKGVFMDQIGWRHSSGIRHAGHGAYHIEYDYPGKPDYALVRQGISTLNPPIHK